MLECFNIIIIMSFKFIYVLLHVAIEILLFKPEIKFSIFIISSSSIMIIIFLFNSTLFRGREIAFKNVGACANTHPYKYILFLYIFAIL